MLIFIQATVKLLYPSDYLPTPNPAQTRLIDKFATGLESALQISRTNMSLAELWKRDCPDGAEHGDIAEYLETVSDTLDQNLREARTKFTPGRHLPFLS